MGNTGHHTVEIVGPTRYRFRLTKKELEELKASDHVLPNKQPVEWEPVGSKDEWSLNANTGQSETGGKVDGNE